MNYTYKLTARTIKKVQSTGIRRLIQSIFTAMLIFPVIILAQTSHEGHSIQSHSLTHWMITIALIAVIGWGVYKIIQRRKIN